MSELASLPSTVMQLLPAGEVPIFIRERQGARADVLTWLPVCAALAEASHGARGALAERLARQLGCSPATVRRRFRSFQKDGWRGLINRAKHPEPDNRGLLPPATIEWIRTLYHSYQRNNGAKQVRRYMLDRWHKWAATLDAEFAIPGYPAPPPAGSDGVPAGWSYRTICRLRPDRAELSHARQGRKAGHQHLPSNYTTRAGLHYLQRIFYDDQVYDTKVNNGLNREAVRPHGFNALDHLSGAWIDWTIKAIYWDVEEGRRRELTQRDFTFFHLRGLLTHGYRDDELGTTCIFEHGTTTGFNNQALATLPWRGNRPLHSYDDALSLLTGGRVTVERSGRFNDPLFAGMLFRPQSTGNFRFKSPIESLFNLVRNYHAALPGATGQDRHHAPEDSFGEDSYHLSLARLAERLPAERLSMLRNTYWNFHQFCAFADQTYHLINDRTDHQLEGWDRCGFVQPHFRLEAGMPWMLEDEIFQRCGKDPERTQAVLSLSESRPLSLSPAQVRDVLQADPAIRRLDPDLVPFLLPTAWAYDVKVNKQHEIHLSDPALYPGCKASFIAAFEDGDTKTHLRAGRQLKAFWHPIMDRLWVTTRDGAYIGCLREFQRPTASDRPAIIRNQGHINSLASTITASAVRRAQGIASERQEVKRHNDRLADLDQPATPEEKRAKRAGDRLTRPASSPTSATDTGLTFDDI